ncbi:MAG TPA: hypothetical protein VHW23_34195 [Kofleriaceae bacterium]|jgi:hypothetical protein|nr:hypothetical protein [Kofleriaceae bacterium]
MKPHLLALILAILGASATRARADAFAFKDVEGFERCMQLDHLVETVHTDQGAQTRLLSPFEIQLRCIDAATKLLAPSKKPDEIIAYVKVTSRLSAPENATGLGALAAAVAPAACNDIAIYSVVIAGLAHRDDPYVDRAKALARQCLKDGEFRKDFSDELKNDDPHVRAHACDVMLAAKLVKSCAGSRP